MNFKKSNTKTKKRGKQLSYRFVLVLMGFSLVVSSVGNFLGPAKTYALTGKQIEEQAQKFCDDKVGGFFVDTCKSGYIAGVKAQAQPEDCRNNSENCITGYNEGKKLRQAETPKRDDCNETANPKQCKKDFDKCNTLSGLQIATQVKNCKIDVLLKEYQDPTPAVDPATANAAGDEDPDCSGEGGISDLKPAMAWIICPVTEFMANVTNDIFKYLIAPMLENVPISADPDDGSYKAWQGFRLIANILLVGSLLAVVYSQARGGE